MPWTNWSASISRVNSVSIIARGASRRDCPARYCPSFSADCQPLIAGSNVNASPSRHCIVHALPRRTTLARALAAAQAVAPERRLASIAVDAQIGPGPARVGDAVMDAILAQNAVVSIGERIRVRQHVMHEHQVGRAGPQRRGQQRVVPQAKPPVDLVNGIGQQRREVAFAFEGQPSDAREEIQRRRLKAPSVCGRLQFHSVSV